MPDSIHAHTPCLDVVDSRAAPVRQLNYCRVTDGETASRRVERHIHDAAGRDVAQWDARLVTRANTARVFGLGGRPVLEDNVDAGWRLTLPGEAGQPVFEWDGRGGEFQTTYDGCLRVTTRREGARVVERCYYGEAEAAGAANCAGRPVRQLDSAGWLETLAYGLGGQVQVERRRFLRQIEAMSWPATTAEQEALLQAQAWTTTDSFDACGMLRSRVDAGGHRRQPSLDVAGQLASMTLTLAGSSTQVVVCAIHYNAHGQVESELLGNGTRTHARYAADNGRLLELTARRADGSVIRALQYRHDPVGNILAIEDLAEPPRFYRNQRIDGVCRYRYDSLYQLTEATGWEVDVAQHGAGLPPLQAAPLDPSRLRRYTRTFTYDQAGNLLRRNHSDAPSLEMFTSAFSNRSLESGNEADIAEAFDANGNRLYLGAGQALRWSARNQLLAVTTVARAGGRDDGELYAYDASGLRARKQSRRQVAGRTLSAEVLYLPGVEIHHDPVHDESWHALQLDTGRDGLQVLRWVNGSEQSGTTQLRYSLVDHLGSGNLELDGAGQLLSQESYYPFGGTAIWAGRNAVEARYKTRRYSGKELDATGLYYYGFRYYAPWLQRWLSADPAGNVDGLNRYWMVKNRPVAMVDSQGLASSLLSAEVHPAQFFADKNNAAEIALEQRLLKYQSDTQKRLTYIVEKVVEDIYEADGFIFSQLVEPKVDAGGVKELIASTFENDYLRDEWRLGYNYRLSETNQFYAADVTFMQYKYVALAEGFYGRLPSVITRKGVTNEKTLAEMEGVETGASGALDQFMSNTPNGRSTQRILDAFGLKATSLEIIRYENADPDFRLQVVPVLLSDPVIPRSKSVPPAPRSPEQRHRSAGKSPGNVTRA